MTGTALTCEDGQFGSCTPGALKDLQALSLSCACLQSTYIWGFWEDHRLRKLWTEGKLEFVLWDSTAECVGHLKCMQVTPASTETPSRPHIVFLTGVSGDPY